jgi:hypothetical protein
VASSTSQGQPLPLFAGCVFLVIGVALLFDNWGLVNLKTSDLFPLVIVAVGIGTIVIALSRVVPGRGESSAGKKPETR